LNGCELLSMGPMSNAVAGLGALRSAPFRAARHVHQRQHDLEDLALAVSQPHRRDTHERELLYSGS
jgi:hypothetical protein